VSQPPPHRTPLARLAVLVAGAFLAVTVGVFALPAPAAAWSVEEFSGASESELVQLTNQARASAGLPALVVPCGADQAGMPIGLQIIAQPFDEATALRIGAAYEQASDWHRRSPIP